jgi:hypothetical protein
MDDLGNLSESVTVVIQLDTVPPAPPSVSIPASSPNPVTITGTKEAGAFVRLNGRRITAASDETAWTYQATLTPPLPPETANILRLTTVDDAGNESAPVSVSVTLTGPCVSPPRPVFPLAGNAIRWGRAFSWTPQVGATNYLFELSASQAFDTLVVSPPPVLVDNRFEPATPAPPVGVYYWRVGAVDALCTCRAYPKVIIGSTTGDVTGDGFADIFVGVSGDDRADLEAGAAYLYQEARSGCSGRCGDDRARSVPGVRHRGSETGDIDSDGYVDLLVGLTTRIGTRTRTTIAAPRIYIGRSTLATTQGWCSKARALGGVRRVSRRDW